VSLTNELEAYRRSCALRLGHDQKDRRTVAEQLQARLLQIQKEAEAASAPLRRARSPLPGADICPRCWIDRGLQIPLQRAKPDACGDPAQPLPYRCTAPTCLLEIAAPD
jgi:hypothetical protein